MSGTVTIIAQARGWQLQTTQLFAAPRERVFAFFADVANLQRITPPWLHFRILSSLPLEMREGTLIDYRLRLRGVPIRWRTEICQWQPSEKFMDRQLRGPYLDWEHTHIFTEIPGGTRMEDQVNYRVPGGRLVHSLIVRRDLLRIFEYRRDVLQQLLPQINESPAAL